MFLSKINYFVSFSLEINQHTETVENANIFKPTKIESAGCPIPEKFTENNMYPSIIEGKRALYDDPTIDFVLKYALYYHQKIHLPHNK